ncbi:MAG: RDD family protein [Planctomycetales bacterium]|nr:RDD family protein [Planctomycetales bacterium]
MSSRSSPIDGQIQIVTPENIAFEYRLAGPFVRLPAYLLDKLLQFACIFVLGMVLMFTLGSMGMPGLGMGTTFIFTFVLNWFYGGLFETFWNGQTPGKRAMGIRVVTTDGQPITAIQAVLRNFLRLVDGLPMAAGSVLPLFQFGLICCLLNRRFQRLGDIACGTMVIYEMHHGLRGLSRVDEPLVRQLAAAIPPAFPVDRNLARALSKYVDRRRFFSPARRAEIARHVAQPLCERFGLPPNTSGDALLCALYNRSFITEMPEEERRDDAPEKNPFLFNNAKPTALVDGSFDWSPEETAAK